MLPKDQTPVDRRRTLLQEGTLIKGEFTADGIVELAGQVIGDVTVDTLVLAREGRVEGTIRARNVTVEGTLKGAVIAQTVMIKTNARVTADITCQTLGVEPGAEITGTISRTPVNAAP